ncbi:MAG TPA: glutathione S-transferase family protein [Pseudolabrys sp.]|nr:glutathione S-transferase family protein [Pseudolabrys sp.]
MSLKLYYHPLSSFCHKALIALYENGIAFEPVFVDLGDADSSAALRALWPVGKFPVLRDEARGQTIAEATVIIEYLDLHYAGTRRMLPVDADGAWQTRMWDRFFDLYVHVQMQKIVGDNLRPAGSRDRYGVDQAKAAILNAYAMIDHSMAERTWAMGDAYGLVDCAASPALFYANCVLPIDGTMPNLAAYYRRLMVRPSYARALKGAEPYFRLFPMEPKPQIPTEAH